MIKPAEAFFEIDVDLDDDVCTFSRITNSSNRSMPVRSHASSASGKRRSGSRRKRALVGMHNRYNKKVLHEA